MYYSISRSQESYYVTEVQKKYDNEKIPIEENIILNRITYIVFPIWKLDELLKIFQEEL